MKKDKIKSWKGNSGMRDWQKSIKYGKVRIGL